MMPLERTFRRGLATLLIGIAVLLLANLFVLLALLSGPGATGIGALVGLALAIVGILAALVGGAEMASRPAQPGP